MDLKEMRDKIDAIDRQIVSLLNARYEVVREVGKWKLERGLPIYVPEREKALLEKLDSLNQGPMLKSTLHSIYREIMSGAYPLEQQLRVAYFGPAATYTHQAAKQQFGSSVEYYPRPDIADVFRDVEAEKVDYGVVPVENSTEGVVNYTLDLLLGSSVKVCAEINLPIHHCLLSKAALSEIRKVYSHPQSLAQCRCWLTEHLPGVELVEAASNTRAAQFAVEEPNSAAICSELAASVYDLKVLETKIEDNPRNTTRFFVVGNQENAPSGNDKTSLCFVVQDRVGALYDCLLPFRESGITLTMIESRPSKKVNWEYVFYVDLLGHVSDPIVKEALEKLQQYTSYLKILGSYPV
ncbi:MAG: prephenate dehydratase [Lentisphaeria bacterium]|nr:prephenate dehydratase [Lentisphaeria bacterium]